MLYTLTTSVHGEICLIFGGATRETTFAVSKSSSYSACSCLYLVLVEYLKVKLKVHIAKWLSAWKVWLTCQVQIPAKAAMWTFT